MLSTRFLLPQSKDPPMNKCLKSLLVLLAGLISIASARAFTQDESLHTAIRPAPRDKKISCVRYLAFGAGCRRVHCRGIGPLFRPAFASVPAQCTNGEAARRCLWRSAAAIA